MSMTEEKMEDERDPFDIASATDEPNQSPPRFVL